MELSRPVTTLAELVERFTVVWKSAMESLHKWVESLPPELLELLDTLAEEDEMEKPSRQAVMKVSRELLEHLLPDWRTVAMLRYGELVESRLSTSEKVHELAAPFYKALKLPLNCKITGISTGRNDWFYQDQIAFRVESPDFKETTYCGRLPEVQAVYQTKHRAVLHPDGTLVLQKPGGYFLCWTGEAVAVQRVYGPDGEELHGEKVCPAPDELPDNLSERIEMMRQDIARQGVAATAAYYGADLPAEAGGFLLPEGSEELLEALEEKGVLDGKPVSALSRPCWRCGSPTGRRLTDGTAECRGCSEKSLL